MYLGQRSVVIARLVARYAYGIEKKTMYRKLRVGRWAAPCGGLRRGHFTLTTSLFADDPI